VVRARNLAAADLGTGLPEMVTGGEGGGGTFGGDAVRLTEG